MIYTSYFTIIFVFVCSFNILYTYNLYICVMVTYGEKKENTFYYTLIKDCEVLGTFGNLKRLCEFVGDEKPFPSYWTLVRKKDNLKDGGVIYAGAYKIQRVKHYSGTISKSKKPK